jgi:hypothetical protein
VAANDRIRIVRTYEYDLERAAAALLWLLESRAQPGAADTHTEAPEEEKSSGATTVGGVDDGPTSPG